MHFCRIVGTGTEYRIDRKVFVFTCMCIQDCICYNVCVGLGSVEWGMGVCITNALLISTYVPVYDRILSISLNKQEKHTHVNARMLTLSLM